VTVLWCYLRNPGFKTAEKDYHVSADLSSQANHLGVTIQADIIKQKLSENNGGYNALKFGLDPGATPDAVITSTTPGTGNFPATPHYLAPPMPWFSTLFVFASLSSIGLPFLNGFVGEFLILIGTWTSTAIGHPFIVTMLAATGVIWAAVYMLWMLQRVVFGPVTNPENAGLLDLNKREVGLLIPLLILMLFMGVYPRVFLDRSKASVEAVRNRASVRPGGGSIAKTLDVKN